jgi:hypothetical protein
VTDIADDPTLVNATITITLDFLRVKAYPGGGSHQVLFDFSAQQHYGSNAEQLHFTQTFGSIQEGDAAGVIGYPIFKGLNVGSDGAAFQCTTVNVQNNQDQTFINFLDSDVFKSGLQLIETFEPAITPLTGLATGIVKGILNRNANVKVQDFYMGLDFKPVATHARLREGSYIAAQVPEDAGWNWGEWVYDPVKGRIVNKADPTQLIPYNYMIFGVSRS